MIISEPGHYSCVYQIRNLVNGKVYVGSAVDFQLRFWQHRVSLRSGKHHSPRLQNAYNKYGAENFVIEPLERVGIDDLMTTEQLWLDSSKSSTCGYNICPTADSCLGRTHSEETKRKISEGNKGKVIVVTDRMRLVTHLTHIGKTVSEETRKKLSLATKGKHKKGHPMSDENQAKLIASRLGKPGTPWTEERRQKESIRMTGNIPGNKGIPITDEHRQRISAGLKQHYENRRVCNG